MRVHILTVVYGHFETDTNLRPTAGSLERGQTRASVFSFTKVQF